MSPIAKTPAKKSPPKKTPVGADLKNMGCFYELTQGGKVITEGEVGYGSLTGRLTSIQKQIGKIGRGKWSLRVMGERP